MCKENKVYNTMLLKKQFHKAKNMIAGVNLTEKYE